MKQKMRYSKISWYSKEDGPGTRVVLFLQGCNLRCKWCHSPHSHTDRPPILYYADFCTACGKCAEICPQHCHNIEGQRHRFSREKCNLCLQCVGVCSRKALAYDYYEATPAELYRKLKPELRLLGEGGGITVSGGEPLLQWQEVKELLELCKADGFHTAVETSASISGQAVSELDGVVDCWLFGLKQTDPGLCRDMTGADISVVLSNLKLIASESPDKIIIRTPLIPGYTNDETNLSRIREIMDCYHIGKQELLPFNPNTEHYYTAGGIPYLLDIRN